MLLLFFKDEGWYRSACGDNNCVLFLYKLETQVCKCEQRKRMVPLTTWEYGVECFVATGIGLETQTTLSRQNHLEF